MSVSKLFRCSCNAEGIIVDDLDENEVALGFWTYGDTSKINFLEGLRQRIKYIWKILKDGTPYTDTIILDGKTAKEFAQYILDSQNKNVAL